MIITCYGAVALHWLATKCYIIIHQITDICKCFKELFFSLFFQLERVSKHDGCNLQLSRGRAFFSFAWRNGRAGTGGDEAAQGARGSSLSQPMPFVSCIVYVWSSALKQFLDRCHARPLLLALASQGIFDVSAWLCVSFLLAASRAASTSAGHEWAEPAGISRRRSYIRWVVSLLLENPWGRTATTPALLAASPAPRLCSFAFFPADSQAKERLLPA